MISLRNPVFIQFSLMDISGKAVHRNKGAVYYVTLRELSLTYFLILQLGDT